MSRAYADRNAFGRAVTARLEHRHVPIPRMVREGDIVPFNGCGHERRLPGRREG
jgi:hypothetical protein